MSAAFESYVFNSPPRLSQELVCNFGKARRRRVLCAPVHRPPALAEISLSGDWKTRITYDVVSLCRPVSERATQWCYAHLRKGCIAPWTSKALLAAIHRHLRLSVNGLHRVKLHIKLWWRILKRAPSTRRQLLSPQLNSEAAALPVEESPRLEARTRCPTYSLTLRESVPIAEVSTYWNPPWTWRKQARRPLPYVFPSYLVVGALF